MVIDQTSATIIAALITSIATLLASVLAFKLTARQLGSSTTGVKGRISEHELAERSLLRPDTPAKQFSRSPAELGEMLFALEYGYDQITTAAYMAFAVLLILPGVFFSVLAVYSDESIGMVAGVLVVTPMLLVVPYVLYCWLVARRFVSRAASNGFWWFISTLQLTKTEWDYLDAAFRRGEFRGGVFFVLDMDRPQNRTSVR